MSINILRSIFSAKENTEQLETDASAINEVKRIITKQKIRLNHLCTPDVGQFFGFVALQSMQNAAFAQKKFPKNIF